MSEPGATADDGACGATVARYAKVSRADFYYVRTKLRTDPLTHELRRWVRRGLIRGDLVDLGTGRGQFPLYLNEIGALNSLHGFDHDERKIAVARCASQNLQLAARFETGDLRTAPIPSCDTVLLLDVLHYLGAADQQRVLERAVGALRPSGALFLRETNRGAGARARVAAFFERLGGLFGANRGETLVFLEPVLYAEWLRSWGLDVTVEPARGALGNVLIIAQKPAA